MGGPLAGHVVDELAFLVHLFIVGGTSSAQREINCDTMGETCELVNLKPFSF